MFCIKECLNVIVLICYNLKDREFESNLKYAKTLKLTKVLSD